MSTSFVNVAFVEDKCSPVIVVKEYSWATLQSQLTRSTAGQKDGPAWIPAKIDVGPRTKDRVEKVSALVLDVERAKGGAAIPPKVDEIAAKIEGMNYNAILHTTYSHTSEEPRYRLIFQLDRPLEKAELKPLGQHMAQQLGISGCYDRGALEPSRLYYLPRCPPERAHEFRGIFLKGDPIHVDDVLREAASRFSTPADLNLSPPRSRLTKLGASLIQFPLRPGTPEHNNSHTPKPKTTALDDTPNNRALVINLLNKVSSDCDRDKWRSIVWSVLSTGLKCAEELALNWSIQSDRYTETDFNNLIRDYDPNVVGRGGNISIGTLYHHVREQETVEGCGNECN